jgi:hypothetical protein
MRLNEIFEAGISVRKIVWTKRGDTVVRREVERVVATDLPQRTHIENTSKGKKTNDAE